MHTAQPPSRVAASPQPPISNPFPRPHQKGHEIRVGAIQPGLGGVPRVDESQHGLPGLGGNRIGDIGDVYPGLGGQTGLTEVRYVRK